MYIVQHMITDRYQPWLWKYKQQAMADTRIVATAPRLVITNSRPLTSGQMLVIFYVLLKVCSQLSLVRIENTMKYMKLNKFESDMTFMTRLRTCVLICERWLRVHQSLQFESKSATGCASSRWNQHQDRLP